MTVADERAPMFDSTSFTAELKENEPIGSFVIALSGESQSTLTYDIVDSGMPSWMVWYPSMQLECSNFFW